MNKAIVEKDDDQMRHIQEGHLNEKTLTEYVTDDQSDWSEMHKIL